MTSLQSVTFSPKEMAQVIGVSQSSIKRWVDAGLITVSRTAGGHRRIPGPEVLRFVRDRKLRIVDPSVLGLEEINQAPRAALVGELTGDQLYQMMLHGTPDELKGAMVGMYLAGVPLAHLWDVPVREALGKVGELWLDGNHGIYAEHRTVQICVEAVARVATLIPSSSAHVLKSLGGGPSDDPYQLAPMMVSSVLTEQGWDNINIGPNTPETVFVEAVKVHQPDLFWLSISSPLSEARMEHWVTHTLRDFHEQGIAIVIGGRSAGAVASLFPSWVHYVQDLRSLSALAKELASARRAAF